MAVGMLSKMLYSSVFTPKHPRTRPTLNVVEAAEQKLDVEQLLKNCLEKTEIRHL